MISKLWVLVVFALAAQACGDGAEPDVDLDGVLARAATNFESLESVRFDIVVGGSPVFLDAAETLAAKEATGQYSAPESFQAVVQVTAFDLGVELGAISIGETRWVTNPVTGRWEELPAGIGFDPLELFDEQSGIAATLAGMRARMLVSANGDFHVQGIVGAQRVRTLTAGLLEGESVEIDVFIDDEFRLEEVTFAVGEPVSEWSIRFSEFNKPVTINPPST